MNALTWADEPTGDDTVIDVIVPEFADFYRDHRTRLARALAVVTGDGGLAAEAIDEAMTRAYARWSRVSQLDNPAGWVYRVGLNWSRTALMRRRRPMRAPGVAAWIEHPTAPEPSIADALRQLSADQRAVVVCRHLLGWSEEQTAEALGLRLGTVKSRSHRALQILQRRLAHLDPEAPDA